MEKSYLTKLQSDIFIFIKTFKFLEDKRNLEKTEIWQCGSAGSYKLFKYI